MAGGDLGTALSRDVAENGGGARRRLGWYARGRVVLLCVARGLAYLHSERVRCWRVQGSGMWKGGGPRGPCVRRRPQLAQGALILCCWLCGRACIPIPDKVGPAAMSAGTTRYRSGNLP